MIFALKKIALGAPGLLLHLYGNNVPITTDTSLGMLTLMDAVFPAIPLTLADFTFFVVNNHVAAIIGPNKVFQNLSGVDQFVYGYAIADPTDTYLFQGALFDLPPLTVINNGFCPVTPIIGTYSANAN